MNIQRVILGILAFLLVVVGILFVARDSFTRVFFLSQESPEEELETTEDTEELEVFAQELEIPWDIDFLPTGEVLVTERDGELLLLSEEGQVLQHIEVAMVAHRGEGGLLGIALHPNFEENNFIYLYNTVTEEGETRNRVDRYVLDTTGLRERTTILEDIPGAQFHNGGQLAFGPDGYLYITTGDATDPNLAQDTNSVAGKILRLTDTGAIPEDNPFGNPVYSYGHRNPQGLAWDSEGQLWSTEHGPSSAVPPNCCQDELNMIEKGGNYGWPIIKGDEAHSAMISPVIHSGLDNTWAPAGLAHRDDKLYFGGLRGETLYVFDTETNRLTKHFIQQFGRLRATVFGPDNLLYMTTSNQDGRGDARLGDDKIFRLSTALLFE